MQISLNSLPTEIVPASKNAVEDAFPAINTPEWDAMNKRRAALICKDLDEGLTPLEREEYERLQRLSLKAVETAFPHPKPNFEELARLREELRATSAPVTE